jgi:cytoskeletal protein RodZ
MKTSFEVQDSPELSSVLNSHPDAESEPQNETFEGELGYDIMDDIQKSQSNYITEYIVIPLCVIGLIGLIVFLFLKFVKKGEEPGKEEGDVEKQALQDNAENAENVENAENAPESGEKPAEDSPAEAVAETTENVGQEPAEQKKEEEAKE